MELKYGNQFQCVSSYPTSNTYPAVADGEVEMMLGSVAEAEEVVLTATQESSQDETAAAAL